MNLKIQNNNYNNIDSKIYVHSSLCNVSHCTSNCFRLEKIYNIK